MHRRIDNAISRIVGVMKEWGSIDSVACLQPVADPYDPYFFLSFDIYHAGDVPESAERERLLGDVGAFEAASSGLKDRFFVGDIPVRLEFKSKESIDRLVAAAAGGQLLPREAGTYVFYRLVNAEISFQISSWLDDTRATLSELPDAFWEHLADRQRSAAEHLFGDLAAAAARSDELYFTVSAGRFVAVVCSLLFTVNKRFEPSGRNLAAEVSQLHALPQSLAADMDAFVSDNDRPSMERRAKLAELMLQSAFSL